MKEAFKAAKVTDKVWWVGAIDWSVRDFHGYLTGRGTTYNAFLVMDEKVALVDTVKAPFMDEMMARVASVLEPERIDYVISNHAEPDHSGSLARTIAAVSPEKTFASANGAKALDEHFRLGEAVTAVADGEQLSLGRTTATFAETRMCHWPDSMVTYLAEEELLFSQDIFGMHLATYERFDDQLDDRLLDAEAAKYFANILLPLTRFVEQGLKKLADTGWALKIIAPDHGPIWRSRPGEIVNAYARWSRRQRTDKAIVVYDTMWRSTELMARAVGEGLSAGGARARLMPLSGVHRSDVATEMLDAGALLVGAPTINREMFPTVADCLYYLKGLSPQGLLGAVFGSYGWGGEAPRDLRGVLEEMDVELVGEPVRAKYVPDAEALRECFELGREVADRLAKGGRRE
jgi:flavorubredoxin